MKVYVDALRRNMRKIKDWVGPNTDIIAVVKANGYGYGDIETSRIAIEEGYTALAVAIPEEAKRLREHGFTCPIYILSLPIGDAGKAGWEADGILPVCESTDLASLDKAAAAQGKIGEVMVAVDTGMNRIGVQAEEVLPFLEEMAQWKHLRIRGFFTHFACADGETLDHFYMQKRRFDAMIEQIPNKEQYLFTAANSAATLDCPEAHYDAVRPGMILYGHIPSAYTRNKIEFEQIFSLVSEIVHIHKVPKGSSIGYGATYVCPEDTYIGTIPIGYADGYSRLLSNKGYILVGGKRCPIVGRVCMDQLMIDLGLHTEAKVGDEAVLIGEQGDEEISIGEVANWIGTMTNEISCDLSHRIPRMYCNKIEE